MVTSVIEAIIAAITSLINNGLSNMGLTTDVNLWSFIIWAIFISIILFFVNKLVKAVNS